MDLKLSALLAPAFWTLCQPFLALAQQTQQPTSPQWPGPWHMMGPGWGFWWIFPLFMLLIIAICFAAFFFGHRIGTGHRHWGPWHTMQRPYGTGGMVGDPTYSALQILNERFARGEIERSEYEEKRAVILSTGHQ